MSSACFGTSAVQQQSGAIHAQNPKPPRLLSLSERLSRLAEQPESKLERLPPRLLLTTSPPRWLPTSLGVLGVGPALASFRLPPSSRTRHAHAQIASWLGGSCCVAAVLSSSSSFGRPGSGWTGYQQRRDVADCGGSPPQLPLPSGCPQPWQPGSRRLETWDGEGSADGGWALA